jgi:hypothetical protein
VTYNAAPVWYGPHSRTIAQRMRSGNLRLHSIADSYGICLNTPHSRLVWAMAATAPWGRIGAIAANPRILGADTDYNINASGVSNQHGLVKAQINLANDGAGDLTGLWAINADNGNVGYSGPGSVPDPNIAHYGVPMENFFGIGGQSSALAPTGANQKEYARLELMTSYMSTWANKLDGGSGKMAFRMVCLLPDDFASTDSYTRRLMDLWSVTESQNLTLADWPSFRYIAAQWRPTSGDIDGTAVAPGYGTVMATKLDSSHEKINDRGDLILVGTNGSGNRVVGIRGADNIDAGDWCAYGGGIWMDADTNGDWIEGPYVSSWGVNSLDWANIGAASASGKNFTETHAKECLRATTLDTDQHVVFMYNLAEETSGTAALTTSIQARVETIDSAAEDAGISNRHHLLVTNFGHWDSGATGTNDEKRAESRETAEENRAAHRNVVDNLSSTMSISNVSLYDKLNGVILDGDSEAQAYMAGYSAFTWGDGQTSDLSGGDLLEGSGNVHIADGPSGAFYATKLWEAIEREATSGGWIRPVRASRPNTFRTRA